MEEQDLKLIIDGKEISSFEPKNSIHFDNTKYQLLLLDNLLIKNKLVIFRNGEVYCACDLSDDVEIYKHYDKNMLIDIKSFEVRRNK